MSTKMIRLPWISAQRRVGVVKPSQRDLSQIQDAVTFMLAEIIRGILTLIVGIGLILYISPKLTLIMLSVIPIVVVIAVIFGKYIRKLSRKAQDQLADSNTVVQETLQGIANVKAFSNEWFETDRYTRSLKQVVALALQSGKVRGLFISFMLFSLFGAIILVVWFGVGLMRKNSFGDLTAFVVYTSFVGGSMAGFADLYSNLQKTLGATQRVRELLKEETEQLSITEEAVHPENQLHGEVEFRHVAFSYPSRQEISVLKDISIYAKKGEQIALVGPSGAGKSTIAALLLQFYQPDKGTIISMVKASTVCRFLRFGYRWPLFQIFSSVVPSGNITYGKPASSLEEAGSGREAYAHDFIKGFPKMETLVWRAEYKIIRRPASADCQLPGLS
jgi:ABC-type multidrug transport system fused ATPase/permease subunit